MMELPLQYRTLGAVTIRSSVDKRLFDITLGDESIRNVTYLQMAQLAKCACEVTSFPVEAYETV